MLYSKFALLTTQTPLTAQNLATRLSFFALGFSTAAWAPLIPMAQQRLSLNHADFGMLLLSMGIGSMLAMPLTGALVNKLGCRVIIALAMIACVLILPLLSLIDSSSLMAIVLFVFGTAVGALGVAINLQAIVIEKLNLKMMMSSFHGMCSLGGLSGVLMMTALLAIGTSALIATLVLSSILLMILICAVPNCLSTSNTDKNANSNTDIELASDSSAVEGLQSNRTKPSWIIVLIGIMCFIAFLSEGAAMDWSGIYLVSQHGMDTEFAGLAYTFFAITMTLGRFSGQHLLRLFGEQKLVVLSALCAASGLSLIVLAVHWSIVLVGYALLGLGCANIVPIMFSRVGRQNLMPKAAALSLVSTIAYSGALTGPALVGFISEIIGLNYVFACIALMLASIALLNRYTIE